MDDHIDYKHKEDGQDRINSHKVPNRQTQLLRDGPLLVKLIRLSNCLLIHAEDFLFIFLPAGESFPGSWIQNIETNWNTGKQETQYCIILRNIMREQKVPRHTVVMIIGYQGSGKTAWC